MGSICASVRESRTKLLSVEQEQQSSCRGRLAVKELIRFLFRGGWGCQRSFHQPDDKVSGELTCSRCLVCSYLSPTQIKGYPALGHPLLFQRPLACTAGRLILFNTLLSTTKNHRMTTEHLSMYRGDTTEKPASPKRHVVNAQSDVSTHVSSA